MSGAIVRTSFLDFLAANAPTESVVDLNGQYDELEDLLASGGIGANDPWLGVQFVGDVEVPITIGSSNTVGKYRETGAVLIHVVDIAKLGVSDTILTRAETLRTLFRGRKLDTVLIDSVGTVHFDQGAALKFEGGYMCGTFIIGYQNDIDL